MTCWKNKDAIMSYILTRVGFKDEGRGMRDEGVGVLGAIEQLNN